MTTDPTPLQEQIEAALIRATEDGADRTEHYAAAVLPIIRKAERDAARAERARIVSERTRLIAYHDSFCGCDDDISTYPTPPDDWEES